MGFHRQTCTQELTTCFVVVFTTETSQKPTLKQKSTTNNRGIFVMVFVWLVCLCFLNVGSFVFHQNCIKFVHVFYQTVFLVVFFLFPLCCSTPIWFSSLLSSYRHLNSCFHELFNVLIGRKTNSPCFGVFLPGMNWCYYSPKYTVTRDHMSISSWYTHFRSYIPSYK